MTLLRAMDPEIERGREEDNRHKKLEILKKHNEEKKNRGPGAHGASEGTGDLANPAGQSNGLAGSGTAAAVIEKEKKKGKGKGKSTEAIWMWGMDTDEEHRTMNKIHEGKDRVCRSTPQESVPRVNSVGSASTPTTHPSPQKKRKSSNQSTPGGGR